MGKVFATKIGGKGGQSITARDRRQRQGIRLTRLR